MTDRLKVDERARTQLERLAAGGGLLGTRARIVLLAGTGLSDTAIAARLGVSRPTVALWRERYAKDAAAALTDLPRTGRPAVVRDPVVVAASLTRPPDQPADQRPDQASGPYWSARSLAAALGISAFSVRKVWRRWGLTFDATPTWGTQPSVTGYVHEVAGLYLNPPDAALVVRFADDAFAPGPLRPELTGLVTRRQAERAAGEPGPRVPGPEIRSAVAALDETAAGVVDECFPRQRDRDLIRFLRAVVGAAAGARLAVVVARAQMRGSQLIRGWMADHETTPVVLPPEEVGWAEVLETMLLAGAGSDPASANAGATALRERAVEFGALSDRGVDCFSWPYALR